MASIHQKIPVLFAQIARNTYETFQVGVGGVWSMQQFKRRNAETKKLHKNCTHKKGNWIHQIMKRLYVGGCATSFAHFFLRSGRGWACSLFIFKFLITTAEQQQRQLIHVQHIGMVGQRLLKNDKTVSNKITQLHGHKYSPCN